MPEVSVIIPAYNRVEQLRNAVNSVLDQTYKDFELIIVDDGSDDETFERFRKKKPPVRYLYQPRMGVSAARNRGIGMARGEFIAFLDSDDLWKPEKLETQVNFLKANPEVLFCQTEEIWIRSGKRVNPKDKHKKPSGDIFDASLKLCVVSPSAVMMRRKFFDVAGLFDESLPVCEDYDLWLRAAYRMEAPLIPEPLTIKHGGHDDQLSTKYHSMDRFRVYALQKLLAFPLKNEQRNKVISEIRSKCRVLRSGALKRRRYIFAFKTLMTGYFPKINWRIL